LVLYFLSWILQDNAENSTQTIEFQEHKADFKRLLYPKTRLLTRIAS
jgi:hypothetical protein